MISIAISRMQIVAETLAMLPKGTPEGQKTQTVMEKVRGRLLELHHRWYRVSCYSILRAFYRCTCCTTQIQKHGFKLGNNNQADISPAAVKEIILRMPRTNGAPQPKANGNGSTDSLHQDLQELNLQSNQTNGSSRADGAAAFGDSENKEDASDDRSAAPYIGAPVRAYQGFLNQLKDQEETAASVETSQPYVDETGEDSEEENDLLPEDDLMARLKKDGSEEAKLAPMFSRDVLESCRNVLPQYGLLGIQRESFENPRIYINTNAPFSGIISGLQGKGKSHTLSVILESCLIKNRRVGKMEQPLSAMVCHVDPQGGQVIETTRPCEAVSLAMSSEEGLSNSCARDVVVLVSPSNYGKMKQVYREVPNVTVQPLFISEKELTATSMNTLMAIDEKETKSLYMHKVHQVLREMGDEFDYTTFKRIIFEEEFNSMQRSMLNMRLMLLESFLLEKVMEKAGTDSESRIVTFRELLQPGRLVIVDLTDPLMDASESCAYFDILISIFTSANSSVGKLLALDEAHKFLNHSQTALALTNNLSRLIRERRHNGVRTIISTQDPTSIGEEILELSSFLILHSFQSRRWANFLQGYFGEGEETGETVDEWLQKISTLGVGEAMIYCPDALFATDEGFEKLLKECVKVAVRQRITRDLGTSLVISSVTEQ